MYRFGVRINFCYRVYGKMNWSLLFATTALLTNLGESAPTPTEREPEEVPTIFNDIIALIPKQDIKNITQAHLNTDEGFKAAVIYMHSKEWVDLIETIRGNPDWIALKKYLRDSGLDLDTGIKCIERLVENATLHVQPLNPTAKRNLTSYIVDLEKAIPTVKILTLIQEKRAEGANFKALYARLSSEELRGLAEKVIAVPEFKRVVKELADMGLDDISEFLSVYYSNNGWGEFKAL